MATDRQLHRIGNDLARWQRGFHTGMPHGDAIGDGDGAELARRRAYGRYALLHRLRLAHERDVAGCRFIPAGRYANERLMDLPRRQTHRVIERTMRCTLRAFSRVTTGQP